MKKNKKWKLSITRKILISIIALLLLCIGIIFLDRSHKSNDQKSSNVIVEDQKSSSIIVEEQKSSDIIVEDQKSSNTVVDEKKINKNSVLIGVDVDKTNNVSINYNDIDLKMLKLVNNSNNFVYSPLSLKYALSMLSEGTVGNTKTQIDNVLQKTNLPKYNDNSNMALANALFIKDTVKDNINKKYITTLKNKYNASIVYDSFDNATNINKWISNKTFNLINNMFEDDNVADKNFILINSLTIDMEWVNHLQDEHNRWGITYNHEAAYNGVAPLEEGYANLDFNGSSSGVQSVKIEAVANRYDIINHLGEENIRKEVYSAYKEWLKEGNIDEYGFDLDIYMKELASNYKKYGSSTDFKYYVDDDVKVFAKNLKTYNNTTLQYIGIMPTQTNLETYINNITTDKINNLISSLKTTSLSSYDYDVVTMIKGTIPLFKYDYNLNLVDKLKSLGVSDVFDRNKANISGIINIEGSYIESASQKNIIDFNNIGIKASSVVEAGGSGCDSNEFDYIYDVPIKIIDLTFNRPFMYLIGDKKTGEIWYMGAVYNPVEFDYETMHGGT